MSYNTNTAPAFLIVAGTTIVDGAGNRWSPVRVEVEGGDVLAYHSDTEYVRFGANEAVEVLAPWEAELLASVPTPDWATA